MVLTAWRRSSSSSPSTAMTRASTIRGPWLGSAAVPPCLTSRAASTWFTPGRGFLIPPARASFAGQLAELGRVEIHDRVGGPDRTASPPPKDAREVVFEDLWCCGRDPTASARCHAMLPPTHPSEGSDTAPRVVGSDQANRGNLRIEQLVRRQRHPPGRLDQARDRRRTLSAAWTFPVADQSAPARTARPIQPSAEARSRPRTTPQKRRPRLSPHWLPTVSRVKSADQEATHASLIARTDEEIRPSDVCARSSRRSTGRFPPRPSALAWP